MDQPVVIAIIFCCLTLFAALGILGYFFFRWFRRQANNVNHTNSMKTGGRRRGDGLRSDSFRDKHKRNFPPYKCLAIYMDPEKVRCRSTDEDTETIYSFPFRGVKRPSPVDDPSYPYAQQPVKYFKCQVDDDQMQSQWSWSTTFVTVSEMSEEQRSKERLSLVSVFTDNMSGGSPALSLLSFGDVSVGDLNDDVFYYGPKRISATRGKYFSRKRQFKDGAVKSTGDTTKCPKKRKETKNGKTFHLTVCKGNYSTGWC